MDATQTYEPVHLKRWTMPDCYIGEVWPNYYSSGFGQSRDSDALERSNFTTALKALGGESETVIVVRESHWAVGWVEWIAIHADDGAALRIADDLRERYDSYPVLDEEHFSDLEWNEAADYWDGCSPREKVRMAMHEREHYHWLQDVPVWVVGRWDFSTLANAEGRIAPIANALYESLREI